MLSDEQRAAALVEINARIKVIVAEDLYEPRPLPPERVQELQDLYDRREAARWDHSPEYLARLTVSSAHGAVAAARADDAHFANTWSADRLTTAIAAVDVAIGRYNDIVARNKTKKRAG